MTTTRRRKRPNVATGSLRRPQLRAVELALAALCLLALAGILYPAQALGDSLDEPFIGTTTHSTALSTRLTVTEEVLLPRLPEVEGSNLERQSLRLPEDLEGDLNLLFIAFKRSQQVEVDSWLPLARDLAEAHPGLSYYELPTISKRGALARWFINEGMRRGIPDPVARRSTITLYLDKKAFREALDIPHEDEIQVMLADHLGRVLWRQSGAMTEDSAAGLKAEIERRSSGESSLLSYGFPERRESIR